MAGPESREQGRIVTLFRATGAVVIPTSEGRAVFRPSGLPDLYVVHPGLGLCWWWEVKPPMKKHTLTATQEAFVALHDAASLHGDAVPPCYVGTYDDAEALLVRLGLLTRSDRPGWSPLLMPRPDPVLRTWATAQAAHRAGQAAKRGRRVTRRRGQVSD